MSEEHFDSNGIDEGPDGHEEDGHPSEDSKLRFDRKRTSLNARLKTAHDGAALRLQRVSSSPTICWTRSSSWS